MIGGVQRIYRFPSGMGLSLITGSTLHFFPFVWEAAVLKGVTEDGKSEGLDYSTPLTPDVKVFQSDEEANQFIEEAAKLFVGPHWKTISKIHQIRKGEKSAKKGLE